ncbi:uncharacterized protein LOC133180747 isoform X2 [Saccostrea echinata]|uniref:uncharacterized protein LOC133180747 isoform X2 n=1 Tax=Saccostrea echinata TaxID=191078 RepID=UPI002A7F7B8B|nr:uncharacterized protein LOC133180747 isoform X2 [Saccostrea echinata]
MGLGSGDFKLAKKLIDVGADINLRVRSYEQQEAVPPLYYAIRAMDADIVKLLLDSGADVNEYKGYRQCICLQKPEIERYSIILSKYSINLQATSDRTWSPMTRILELYLSAGAKLNTTRWGHCFFYGRGKVYEATPNPLGIPTPCFSCDTVVLLLQHGIDPDQYKLSDVLLQFSDHYYHYRYRFRRDCICVGFHILLHIFIAAGYHYTHDDLDSQDIQIKMKEYGFTMEEPLSLKHSCRSMIRKHLRILNKDTTIFPSVDKLPIPLSLKDYLKLYNIIDLNNCSIDCYIY